MFIFPLIICFLLSLFLLYVLVRHDYVLARKSLLLREIFDVTFIGYVMFLLFGRFAYILGEQQFNFFHIVRFFHILKFPGILFLGGVFGFALVVFLFFSKKKILMRLFDIYALSMYPLFIFALTQSYFGGYFLYFDILIFLLSCVFLTLGIYSYKNYTLRDGSVALLFLCLVSIYTIVSEFSAETRIVFSFFTVPQVVSIGIFIGSSVLLLLHEGIISNGKK